MSVEHKTYWALKMLNLDLSKGQKYRMMKLNELDEFRYHTYENSRAYKERIMRYHDKWLRRKEFRVVNHVL